MYLMKYSVNKFLIAFAATVVMFACTDDDSFTTSPDHLLTFSTDTIRMDTVFSRVPTSRRFFWVYNKSGDGIRCSNVRLANGNQSGFRVNVDGTYLGKESGFQTTDLEIRNKDSVFVNVELTSPMTNKLDPLLIEDNLVFRLESGVEQKINLNAYSWDAEILKDLTVSHDTLISSDKPIVVYGNMRIDSLATATIAPGTTLYFHSKAGLDVYGRLVAEGTPEKNIVFRGDRTDRMFDYLPYDLVSGQWNGIRFHSSSYENVMNFTDVHSTFNGIVCDSSDVSRLKLKFYNSIVHNCQGYGLRSVNSVVDVRNSQLTNTLNDCVAIYGGGALLLNCTIAQFYPFDSNRGAALRFSNGENDGEALHKYPLYQMDCVNSIVTGYADDVVMGSVADSTISYTYKFQNCILRTDSIDNGDNIKNVIWENADSVATDTVYGGEKNFKLVDINKQHFDFHLSNVSKAIGNGTKEDNYYMPTDREGRKRDDEPDLGCYEYVEPVKEQE